MLIGACTGPESAPTHDLQATVQAAVEATVVAQATPALLTAPGSTPMTGPIEPEPTATPTPVPTTVTTPTPTPTPLAPSLLEFDIGVGVLRSQVELIQRGIDFARAYMQDVVGGDIAPDIRSSITIKIVATGKGNQAPGGGGACCTGLDETGPRPFFDVKHPEWDQETPPGTADHRQKVAAHEYAHAWHSSLGCLTIHDQPLGDWLYEGMAEYVAYYSMIRGGLANAVDVRNFLLSAAASTGEADVPLRSLESSQGLWSGHIGYLAVEYLVALAPEGSLAVRIICEEVTRGAFVDEAFERAFGISKIDFYSAWAFQEDLRSTPTPLPPRRRGGSRTRRRSPRARRRARRTQGPRRRCRRACRGRARAAAGSRPSRPPGR